MCCSKDNHGSDVITIECALLPSLIEATKLILTFRRTTLSYT